MDGEALRSQGTRSLHAPEAFARGIERHRLYASCETADGLQEECAGVLFEGFIS